MADDNRYQNRAYYERDVMVRALSKVWPSHLMRHPSDDAEWFKGHSQAWIVCVHAPCGRLAWHIADDDLPRFAHLKTREHEWIAADGAERYERLDALDARRVPATTAMARSGGQARARALDGARRNEIARNAALTRWAGHEKKPRAARAGP